MIGFALRHWRLIAAGIIVLAVLAFIAFVFDQGGDAREAKIEAQAIETEEEVQDVKDKIRNRGNNRSSVIQRLHAGSF